MDRSTTLNDVYAQEGRSYAQPLAGLRVSWGAILAGALAIVAVSTILWALALAIILTATKATFPSMAGSLIALWICAMVTTLIGGLVGGWFAGYLPGNRNTLIGGLHGFLAWGLAFVVMSAMYFGTIGSVTRTAADLTVTTAAAGVQAAGATVGGVAGSPQTLQSKAVGFLESLGYTPAESQAMVRDAQGEIQKTLRRGPATATPTAASVFGPVIDWGAGLAWSWWGTWLVTSALAVFGGMFSARQLSRAVRRPEEEELEPVPISVTPAPEPV